MVGDGSEHDDNEHLQLWFWYTFHISNDLSGATQKPKTKFAGDVHDIMS